MKKTKTLIILFLILASYPILKLRAMEEEQIIKEWQPNSSELKAFNLIKSETVNESNIDQLPISSELKQYLHSFYTNIKKQGPSYSTAFKRAIKGKSEYSWYPNTPAENQLLLNKLLSASADKGYENLVKFLIFLGDDINGTIINGDTILMYAANGQIEIVKLLLGLGANVNAKNKEGKKALDFAEEKGFTEIVKLLKTAVTYTKEERQVKEETVSQ